MVVPIRARGLTLGTTVFVRHKRPEPLEEDDLILAEAIVARAATCIDNARHYTREHSTALILQHSLLPQRLPAQAAVQSAARHLPAGPGRPRAATGSTWSGCREARSGWWSATWPGTISTLLPPRDGCAPPCGRHRHRDAAISAHPPAATRRRVRRIDNPVIPVRRTGPRSDSAHRPRRPAGTPHRSAPNPPASG
jgi:hypothetical protein